MSAKQTILGLALVVGVGGLAGRWLARSVPLPRVDIRFASEVPYNADRTTGKRPGGREMVMVLVASPSCGACRHPDLAPMFQEATESLRATAASDGMPLITVGVSPNWVPAEGWRFLADIMNFDEVMIGRSWLNSELVELGWSYQDADVATPQIIVYEQEV